MSGGFPLGLEVCNGVDIGSVTATSAGTSLTSGAANAYGSFAQLIASTASDTEWMAVNLHGGTNASSFQCAIQIAVGASGSEKAIIHDLVLQCDSPTILTVCLPISIPAGTRISAAAAAATASDGPFPINCQLFDGAFTQTEGVAGVDSIGFVSASTQGTTITGSGTTNTKGSYSQLIASTTRDYLGFFFAQDTLNATVIAASSYLFDIAIGASGSEVPIAPNVLGTAVASLGLNLPITSGLYPIPIPAGSRISARLQSVAASKTIGLTLYGLYR